jgi:NADH-quinone oxidoreductase subunit H
MVFALFFLGEYSNMLLMASFFVLLFFGGWLFPFEILNNMLFFLQPIIFAIKIIFFSFSYIIVRAAFPRYRYDQLMDIGWKIFLPLSLGFFIFVAGILITFNLVIITNFNYYAGWFY